MKFSTSTTTFLVAALALLQGHPVVDALEQKLLRGGGDNIEAGDTTNSRNLALTNGSQKCIAGSPTKYHEVVWSDTITRDVPGGTKCCQSPRDPDRIVFQRTGAKCPCNVVEFIGQDFLAQDSGYDYNIEKLGEVGSLYLQSVGFSAKVGSFSGFPTDTSASYTGGDRCNVVDKNRSGTFHIVETTDPYEQRAITASEPSTCVYKMEMKCFQVSCFMNVYYPTRTVATSI